MNPDRFPSLRILALVLLITSFVFAQSPNTGSIVVMVVDQSGSAVAGASVAVTNVANGAKRELISGNDGSATIGALPVTGNYTVTVSKQGFAEQKLEHIDLRAGETATLKVKLAVGAAATETITVYGTTEGLSTDARIGRSLDTETIDQTPILGRKISAVPLLNSAFRQAKGTGDLFVNQIYVTTGAGSRRTMTFTVDGANNDEGWGRQTSIATLPIGAVQEMTVLSSAFSSEFGWTAGPALNIVTKAGTNSYHGELLYLARPGDMQSSTFSKDDYCPPSVSTCTVPATLEAINAVDIPDALHQFSIALGGPIVRDKTFFFVAGDYTMQDRTTFLSPSIPAYLLPASGRLDWTGHYRQALLDARLDHRFTPRHAAMLRFNIDRFHDDNPQDAVSGPNAPSVARTYARRSWTVQTTLTSTLTNNIINEARFGYLNGDPVTYWSAPVLSTTYTRGGTQPFTIGQSRYSNLHGRQIQFSDTLSWSLGRHYLRIGGNVVHHNSGGFGNEPGFQMLGTFAFKNTTTLPFDQLTLNDVQTYTQPINFGVSTYDLDQWLNAIFVQDHIRIRNDLTVDVGLRYDRQTLTDATKDFAPRVGFAWNPMGDAKTVIRGGYGMYFTQIQTNLVAGYLTGGLDGFTSYSAIAGQLGFPTCLTCVPVAIDPHSLSIPARDITIRAGMRDFYVAQFAKYGLNFNLLPNYPDALLNPRSQVMSIGVEREITKGLVASADYVHQHWDRLVRTVDLNAPSPLDRTVPGQTRSVPAANLTRPIVPVTNGVKNINALMNLGVADYDGLQTQLAYRGRKLYSSISYTLSKATNTTEPDGNGINPNQNNIARLGEEERGPSVLDQRHRAVINVHYQFPWNFTAGTLMQFASARPFSATTGIDNNGDGANNDRPVIDGKVIGKSTFRGTMTRDVGMFVENRIRLKEQMALTLRLEGFNIFNHGNYLGRGQTVYGDGAAPLSTFGQLVNLPSGTTNALPGYANVDPPRMFQIQARFTF